MSKEKAIKHIKTIKSYINCIHEDLLNDIKIKPFWFSIQVYNTRM